MAVPYVGQGHHCGPYSWDTTPTTPRADFYGATVVDQFPRHSSGAMFGGGGGHNHHHHHHEPPMQPHHHHHGPPPQETRRRVCFMGCEEGPSMIGGMRGKKVMERVVEESVDDEADDYINARHKSFELRKWQTFV